MLHLPLYQKWLRWGILNLAIVALYGTVMRYKIAFDFPFFEQKNLLHAHSHFAFSGWITHMLYSGLTIAISTKISAKKLQLFNALIIANLICSFGMLFSFTISGYNVTSIVFSTLGIVVSIFFTIYYLKYGNHMLRSNVYLCAKYGLIFSLISALGPFYLAYMMATGTVTGNAYLGSVYYYLHFQYNGWFFFGALALVMSIVPRDFIDLKHYINLFAACVIPTFFLSILWTNLPMWLYLITVVFTLGQFVLWILILWKGLPMFKMKKGANTSSWFAIFLYTAVIAMTLKMTLQTVSVIPSLSHLVFGMRSVVIAYLHLILLGVFSLFIIGFLFAYEWMKVTKVTRTASLTFLIGVIMNEVLLGIQGLVGFAYISIPYINELLFVAAVLLFVSAAVMAGHLVKHRE
jgi:hypothetical protein